MCTTLIIIIIIGLIIWIAQKNQKPKQADQKSSNYNQEVQELPNKTFTAQELSSLAKAGNLWPSDDKLLQTFSYSNGNLEIRMKNGNSFNAPIKDIICSFSVFEGENYQADLTYGNQKLTIFTYAYLFTDDEWYEIFAYLSYCGTTYGSNSITASARHQRQKMAMIKNGIKIIKFISKL